MKRGEKKAGARLLASSFADKEITKMDCQRILQCSDVCDELDKIRPGSLDAMHLAEFRTGDTP